LTRVFLNRTTHHLEKCAEPGGGEIDESKVAVKSWDFNTGRFQGKDKGRVLNIALEIGDGMIEVKGEREGLRPLEDRGWRRKG
jgi:hypothetical protein